MSLLSSLFGTTHTDEDDEQCDHDWGEWIECPAGDWGSLVRHWDWAEAENKPFVFITVHEERPCYNCDKTETRNKRQLRQFLEISHTEVVELEDEDPDG